MMLLCEAHPSARALISMGGFSCNSWPDALAGGYSSYARLPMLLAGAASCPTICWISTCSLACRLRAGIASCQCLPLGKPLLFGQCATRPTP
eukprot:8570407-Pyramimonas_sp.AAC.1